MLKQIADWIANIVIAISGLVALWILLQVTTYASFKVPTNSMEPTLLAGDYVYVNKWIVGGRFFNVFDALNGKQTSVYRLPGLREIERNDVLVFNYPYPQSLYDSLYMDVMLYYVKRCIALPGDTLEINKAHYHVYGFEGKLGNQNMQHNLEEMLHFESTETIRALGVNIEGIWGDSIMGWSLREMGPVFIPKRGSTLQMNRENFVLYGKLIAWELGARLEIDRKGDVLLNETLLPQYTFTKDYYFMAGDNAAHSKDSRYWGLVPEEFIVGVATHIWKSEIPDTGKIRWNRVLKKIE